MSFDNVDNTYPSVSTPLIGDAVTRAASAQAQQTSGVVGYRVEDASKYNNDPMRVRQAVYDEHVWAAIIVNTNATYLLQEAVSQGNASYDPLGAMQLIYIQARDQETYASYIIPQLTAFLTNVQAEFGQQWIANVLSDSSYSSNTYQNAPQALNPAIGTSMFNLRPFGPPTATPAVSIGLIYLIIVSFFTFPFYLPIHQQFLVPKGHPPLHFYQLILWRLCATITAYVSHQSPAGSHRSLNIRSGIVVDICLSLRTPATAALPSYDVLAMSDTRLTRSTVLSKSGIQPRQLSVPDSVQLHRTKTGTRGRGAR